MKVLKKSFSGIHRQKIAHTNNVYKNLISSLGQETKLNSKTDIKHIATGWTDKKPFSCVALPFKH